MRARIIAVVATVSLLLSAGIASASSDETDPRVDTLFSFGYDPQAQLFFYNTHATHSAALDCTLTGTLTATYGEAEDGVVPIAELVDDEGAAVMFDPADHELVDGVTPAEGSIAYTDAIDECGISGIPVGAQGHINHGQFMKLFNETIDMRGRGCLNRWLAQSNLGKDGQQVKTPDFEADIEIGTEGTIEFTTVQASCDHGKKDKAEDHPGRGHNKDEADAADTDQGEDNGRPGKSDKAPGRNKNKNK